MFTVNTDGPIVILGVRLTGKHYFLETLANVPFFINNWKVAIIRNKMKCKGVKMPV
jgi:hypothetical protein